MTIAEPRAFLEALFRSAIAAADPAHCVPPHLPPPPRGRTVAVGAGKAAASMAKAAEDAWPGQLSGLAVTRYGHALPTRRIEVVEAAHPVPDAVGLAAAERLLASVAGLSADDLVLALISGGGSALLTCPAPGVSLADMQALNRALLASGAAIGEMNCVRKHLSRIAGGRLAAAARPAAIATLAVSDVPGDDPATIASGPTVADPTTLAEARAVLARHGVAPSPAIAAALADPANESVKPGDPRLARATFRLVASPAASLAAAARIGRQAGLEVETLGDAVEGEARLVGAEHARLARAAARRGRPALILSGGETTVAVKGRGRGGRNAEFLLGLVIALDGAAGVHALAGDTDGIDGSEDNAGAYAAPDALARARAAGLDAARMLEANDAYGFFAGIGGLVVTGPTLTNVNDFRAILVLPPCSVER